MNRVVDFLAKRDRSMSMAPAVFFLAPEDIVELVGEKQREGSEDAELVVCHSPRCRLLRMGLVEVGLAAGVSFQTYGLVL
ncbi:hypothetical protein V6N13_083835 [Hibiscus sabdariffa]